MNFRKYNSLHVRKVVIVTNKRDGQLFGSSLAWSAATIQNDLCELGESHVVRVGSGCHAPVYKAKRVKMWVF